MQLHEKPSFLDMKYNRNFFIYKIVAKAAKCIVIGLFVFAFQSCEKENLISPNSPSMKKNTNYLESSYGYRQDGSPVLVKIGITDESGTNPSYENKGDDNDDSIIDTDGDDDDGDSGVIDKDGDDDDDDGEGTID